MIRHIVVLLAAAMLTACASMQQAKNNRYCGLNEGDHAGAWTELEREPANAEAYRVAALGRGNTPNYWRGHRQLWFTTTDGATRLCALSRTMPGCSGGYWDFAAGSDTPTDGDESQWICVS